MIQNDSEDSPGTPKPQRQEGHLFFLEPCCSGVLCLGMQSTSNIVTLLRFVRVILAKKSGHHTPPSCWCNFSVAQTTGVHGTLSKGKKALCLSQARLSPRHPQGPGR